MATPLEQLELMKQLKDNFDGYGGAPPAAPVLELAKELVGLIEKVRSLSKPFEGMYVTPGRDGSVLIEWDDDEYSHELDVNQDGSIGLLHVEKASGVMTEREFQPSPFSITPGLLTELFEPVAA